MKLGKTVDAKPGGHVTPEFFIKVRYLFSAIFGDPIRHKNVKGGLDQTCNLIIRMPQHY